MRRALGRTTCGVLATVALLAAPSTAATAAPDRPAGSVEAAERDLTALQDQVERTAARLGRGLRQLDDSRAELRRVQRRLTEARRQSRSAERRADAAQERLLVGIAAAYRSPVPETFLLALAGPDEFRATVSARADLSRVHDRHDDLLRTARSERRRAAGAAEAVDRLAEDVRQRTGALQRQVDELGRSATTAERRLRAAARRLSAARTAAERCAGPTGRAPNGFLPRSALCPLVDAPGHALRSDAAAAFARLSAAARTELGGLCVTDSYRSYAQQVDVFARKPDLAAVPGTSRHGYGVALDLGCGVEQFGTPAYRWMKANGPRFGWEHPAWAEPTGSMPEPWHWEYVG